MSDSPADEAGRRTDSRRSGRWWLIGGIVGLVFLASPGLNPHLRFALGFPVAAMLYGFLLRRGGVSVPVTTLTVAAHLALIVLVLPMLAWYPMGEGLASTLALVCHATSYVVLTSRCDRSLMTRLVAVLLVGVGVTVALATVQAVLMLVAQVIVAVLSLSGRAILARTSITTPGNAEATRPIVTHDSVRIQENKVIDVPSGSAKRTSR